MVPLFGKSVCRSKKTSREAKEHSFLQHIVSTRTTKKGEATPTVPSFVRSSNRFAKTKQKRSTEAEGMPGRLGCQSFGEPICDETKKRGQGKPANANRLFGPRVDRYPKQNKKSCKEGGRRRFLRSENWFAETKEVQRNRGAFIPPACRFNSNDKQRKTKERQRRGFVRLMKRLVSKTKQNRSCEGERTPATPIVPSFSGSVC